MVTIDKDKKIQTLPVFRIENSASWEVEDAIVVEEPLEIQVHYFSKEKWLKKSLAITMRTPGDDEALALGFLFSEGIITKKEDIFSVIRLEDNILIIRFVKTVQLEIDKLERHFYSTSSCGVCGKASIDKLEKVACYYPRPNLPKIIPLVIQKLPSILRDNQTVFDQTGGIHAAALFTKEGELLSMQEDVGRHNAVDKLIGKSLLENRIPLRQEILLLSGRISFELVQKAMMAGIPIIVAVGAPSSLAVALAEESGMTLIGFLRGEKFNVYCGRSRVLLV